MRAELYGCSGKNAIAQPILLVSWCWYAHGIGHKASINLGDPGTVSRQGRKERRDKRFQARAEKPLGIETHNTMSKRSNKWWLLIGQKNALYYCAQSANSISWVLLQFQNEACLWNLFIWRKHAWGLFVACLLKKQISFPRRLTNKKLWRLAGILGFNLLAFRQSFKSCAMLCF